MARSTSAWQHLRAALALPFVVTVVVPTALLVLVGPGRTTDTWIPSWAARLLGAPLLVAGLAMIVATVRLFARLGDGTLAPWDPTRRLVVAGPYRYVRNPMITGVFAVLLAESLLFTSVTILLYSGGFAIVNIVYMRVSEEPGLRRRFGTDYETYAANVRAWLPRRTPWQPPR
jgi:protein-S-isoprenylcysteine O-methyltransferase Ste14